MKDNSILTTMNQEQLAAHKAAMLGRNIFLTGGAGTGKTFTLKAIINSLQDCGKNVMLTAPTGIAASLIGGTTIHLALGWGINSHIDTNKNSIKTKQVDALKVTDVLVIDEISMVRRDLFDAIWKAVKKANTKRNAPIQLIVSGDFFQLPPVVDVNRRQDKMLMKLYPDDFNTVFAFQSASWKECGFENHVLTDIFRQKHSLLVETLNKVRSGNLDQACISYLNGLYYATEADPNAVYLFGSNKAANSENERRMAQIQGKEFVYPAKQKFDHTDGKAVEPLPEPVHLKVGCRVMFTANDHVQWWEDRKPQFFNGTMGTVIKLTSNRWDDYNDFVTVRTDDGRTIHVHRVPFEDHEYRLEDGKLILRVCREYHAMPLKLGWAITVHKSQGLTLPSVVIHPQFFADGQAYVAFSRCSDPSKMHLAWPIDPTKIKTNEDVYSFYSSLKAYEEPLVNNTNEENVTYPSSKKGGAPERYKNADTVMKIPMEIHDSLKKYLASTFPKKGSGTIRSQVDMMLAFLQDANDKVTPVNGAKKKFPNKAKAMRVPAEIAAELDKFIWRSFSGLKGSEKRVKAFIAAVDRIVDK